MSLSASFFQQIGRGGLSGKEQNLAGGKYLAYADGSLNAIHVRHDHVTDDQIGPDLLGARYSAVACIDGRGIKAILIEDDGQSIGNYPLIIHDQDSWFGG